jgi:queuosine precursor transporter
VKVRNSLLFVGWALAGLSFLILMYRLFGRAGVYGVVALSAVMMNILVQKSMVIFGLGATGGNVLYALIFLSTDLLNEHYGEKEARRAVWLGFAVSLLGLAAGLVNLLFEPAEWDYAQPHLQALFTPIARIILGSMLAYLLSQLLDVKSYRLLKRLAPRRLWLRNNGSTMTSQLVDTLVFCTVGLLGTMPLSAWWQVVLSTYLLKLIVAALDTPFLYLSRRVYRIVG